HHGTEAERQALETYIKLQRCAESVVSRVFLRNRMELTVSQFGVLEALFHLGPLSPGELGTKILRSGGNMTLVINNLVRRKLVERRRDGQDRRRVVVSLASRGRKLIEDVFPRHVETIVGELAVLTRAEQVLLASLCKRLGQPAEGDGAKTSR
ncbi:MAG: MarR family transcriptional regulator, partial [Deltaproteobacteria bacterium]|nr:MarR family transcriptional regulator [Deltaproteobacteria bacterium]